MAGEVAHLLAAAVLALAFALLTRPRLGALLLVARAQSVVVAAAAAWEAFSADSAVLWGLAVVVLAGAIVLPSAVRQAAGVDRPIKTPRAPLATTAAALLVVLAIAAVQPVHLPSLPPLRENLGLALSAVLVALLMLPTRHNALPQLVGLFALANGVALTAVTVGAPLAVPLAVGVALLFGFVAMGLAVLPRAVS